KPVFLKAEAVTKNYNKDRDSRKKIDDNDNITDIDDEELQEQLSRLSSDAHEEMSSVASDHSDASSTHSMKQHLHLTFLHIVFVLEPPELELCRQVDDIYKNV